MANPDGCDSTFILNLSINHSVTNTVEMVACRQYEWYDTVYYESGTYTYVDQSAAGCDSTIILKLIIEEGISPSGIVGQTQIYPATNLMLGVYNYHIDSTNIDPANVRWGISRDDWRIEPHRASCKVFCLTPGDATLRAWTEGEFCDIDTTLTLNSTFYDVPEGQEATLSIYPNPSRRYVTVSWRDIEKVQVIDMLGQRLAVYKYNKVDSCEIDISAYARGVYLFEITTSEGKAYRQVIRGN